MEYRSAAEVLAAIAWREADVAARMEALGLEQPAAAEFAARAAAARDRRRAERARLASRLGVPPAGVPASPPPGPPGLRGLREATEALVEAHVEGLPAMGDSGAVDLLARHMVALAAQLTVVDLWIELEEER